jgi:hypothetical protein
MTQFGPKSLVFLVCSCIGYFVGHYVPEPFGAYLRILVPYHLFLLYLVFMENDQAGLSMPIGQTIVTHLACLALLVGIAMGRRYVPFFGLIGLFVPALAPFEAEWLFSGSGKPVEEKRQPVVHVVEPETADEYSEFMKYMSGSKREFKKLGISPKDEYNLWRAAKLKQVNSEQ